MLSINSCHEDELQNDLDLQLKTAQTKDKELLNEARDWFENNPEQNEYKLFESAKKIRWEKAIINDFDNIQVVEVPIKMKDNYEVRVINNEQLNVEHRLLIFKVKDSFYSLMEYFISEKDLEYLQDVEKIKYSKKESDFEGVIVLVDACDEVISTEWVHKKLKSAALCMTTYSGYCVGLFYVNPDGSLEWIRTKYCIVAEDSQSSGGGGGGAGSSGTNPPSAENCGCDICTVCWGCTTEPTYSGEPNSPTGEITECPLCECSINPDCSIANSIGINCDVLLAFEQDYKQRMSISESDIFENMSRTQQISYLANAQFASWEAERRYPDSLLYNEKGDAFRHAYWNAANVIELGTALAESLATAHEDKPSYYYFNYKENEMDLFNNNVGRGLWNFWIYHFSSLEECIENAIITGKLKYLNNLAPDGKATKNSQLIPTNQ